MQSNPIEKTQAILNIKATERTYMDRTLPDTTGAKNTKAATLACKGTPST